jgi:hypothetical protein
MIPVAGWVAPFGYPRINACSRLPVAFRSVPRPSSPPGAKASTECPSYTRYVPNPGRNQSPHHAQKPSSDPDKRSRPRMILEICVFRTQHDLLEQQANRSLPQPAANRFDNIVHRASEPSPPTVRALSLQITFPVRQFGRTTEPLIHPKTDRESHAPRNAPEPDSHFKRTTRPPKRP